MSLSIDTLLELYDHQEPIVNVAGAWYLQPRTIFFYYEMEDPAGERKRFSQMFYRIGLRCNIRMEKLERLDIQDMLQWVQGNQTMLGNYAIELIGGDDEMLFVAGCYERFPCRLFTCKTLAGISNYPPAWKSSPAGVNLLLSSVYS